MDGDSKNKWGWALLGAAAGAGLAYWWMRRKNAVMALPAPGQTATAPLPPPQTGYEAVPGTSGMAGPGLVTDQSFSSQGGSANPDNSQFTPTDEFESGSDEF